MNNINLWQVGFLGVIILTSTFSQPYIMIKNAVILILLVLLGISSYLLLETRVPELIFWAKNDNKGIDARQKAGNMEGTIETLGPTPAPEMPAEPTVRLTLGPSRAADEGVEGKEIHLRYELIRPSFLEVLDSTGNTAVEINLQTGEAIFGKEYNPDAASKEFWKSLARNYPEVCVLKQNRE